jgi:hypothetical protein
MSTMRRLLPPALFFGYLALLPSLDAHAHYLVHALVIVVLGTLLAASISQGFSALSVAGGAMGAFAHDGLRGPTPILAGAIFAALVTAERTLRMPTRTARIVHGALALVGGAMAGGIVSGYEGATRPLWYVALAVAVALFAMPLVLEEDDALARALERTAGLLPAGPGDALREAAFLKRNGSAASIAEGSRDSVAKSFLSILKLGEARVQMAKSVGVSLGDDGSKSVTDILDAKIRSQVDVVKKAFAASDAVKAIVQTADTSAVDSLAIAGESMDEVRKALAESTK